MKRWLWRGLKGLGLLLVLAVGYALIDGWRAFGHRATGERRRALRQSPQWSGDKFVNPQPLQNEFWAAIAGAAQASPDVGPRTPLVFEAVAGGRFAAPPKSGLRITWFGHSTALVEIDGARVLTDPVWSMRVSPLDGVGPRRWYAPPLALDDLPPLDAVVISHDHYDHLDRPTIIALAKKGVTFVVPLGVGAHLAYWGVAAERIVELDWWGRMRAGGIELVCTPARHASGRALWGMDGTLWAGWALVGGKHRVYFSGDTGLFPAMRDIGARLGPFDVTMIEVGQYHRAWPDWHIGPEQAVEAHGIVRGRKLLPIHWGAITLAYHAWTEPIERTLAAAGGVTPVLTPRPGESVEPDTSAETGRWWPALKWQTAAEHPIVSHDGH